MVIETKYNKGDKVWRMENNKAIQVEISAIETFHVGTNQDRIRYNAKDCLNPGTWLDHTKLQESDLFPTKEELLASL